MNTQHVSLDLSKAPTYAQMVTIGQGDSGGTTIVADVYDNGQAASLSGMTAGFCMRLPRDAGYVRDSGCTISGNQITYVVNESKCCSVSGRADECYFELLSGNRKYSTSRFRVMIVRAADTDTEAAETWDSAFDIWKQQKDAQVSTAVGNANNAASSANTAANAANAAADRANDAADDAIEATEDANDATFNANVAARYAERSGSAAADAATAANEAATSANAAATSANGAATSATNATTAANTAVQRVDDALESLGDITQVAVPLMTVDVRGGAKLGDGLQLTNGALGVKPMSVATIHQITGMGGQS